MKQKKLRTIAKKIAVDNFGFNHKMKMFGTKIRSGLNTNITTGDETIRRVTREKVVVRGNTTIRTLDSTTSFLPIIET